VPGATGQQVVQLLPGARTDDGRGDARACDGEGHRQVGQRVLHEAVERRAVTGAEPDTLAALVTSTLVGGLRGR
jgi:hypothetical protein